MSTPEQRITVSKSSSAQLPAKEVLRLATSSMIEIKSQRVRAANAAWEIVKDEKCVHFWGLWSHKRYPTREHAERHCPQYRGMSNVGWGDYETCQLLANFANKVMEFDERAMMTITADDFRALS